jgi:molecular chaperone GrpE (heat shock protein)
MADDNPENPVDRILAEVRDLRAAFDAKIRYDEGRERTVAAMGEELDRHRQGAAQAQVRTVLLDLVTLYDDVSQMIGAPGTPFEESDRLVVVLDTVTQIMARQGAELMISDDDVVDRARHKVVSVVKSPDAGADRHIASRLRPGFRWNDRVLRAEWVTAYRYESAGEAAPGKASGEATAPGGQAVLADSRTGGPAGEERDEA